MKKGTLHSNQQHTLKYKYQNIAYLLFYNLFCVAVWGYVHFQVLLSIIQLRSGSELWSSTALPLNFVQGLAILEIVHALVGLVRSSVFTTFTQVVSRVTILYGFTNAHAESSGSVGLYFMLLAWSMVEVPRYSFYAFNIVWPSEGHRKVPELLFFLRYSLFFVLYPMGIFGEWTQIWAALPVNKANNLWLWYMSWILFSIYIPGGPFLFGHMIRQRRNAYRKRNADPDADKKKKQGIIFPPGPRGDHSTSDAGKEVFAASIQGIDGGAAEAVRNVRNWRFGYPRHVIKNVEASTQSPSACVAIAQAGLDYCHSTFQFARDDNVWQLDEAMKMFTTGSFHTYELSGTGSRHEPEFSVPYKDTVLAGGALIDKLNQWASAGTIESSAAEALKSLVENREMCDLEDKCFVLLGAGSAMGPLEMLLGMGATVIAIDLNRPEIWKRIIGKLHDAGRGTLIFPVRQPVDDLKTEDMVIENAGCNLMTETPEIRNWLVEVAPTKELVVGNYCYLDGAAHVLVSLANDAIIRDMCEMRKKKVAVAFLASPSDVLTIPEAARAAQQQNLADAPVWQKAIALLSGGKFLKPAVRPVVNGFAISNGIVVQQGPNYALAKRIQHWRAVVCVDAGLVTSENVAPTTSTASVMHNKMFAAATHGMHYFYPMEVMSPATSSAVMGGLLIHDVSQIKKVKYEHPFDLLTEGSFHGGFWRIGYTPGSIGEVSFIAHYLGGSTLLKIGAAMVGVGLYIRSGYPKPHEW